MKKENLTQFGITRTDPHAWIRDKENPEVIKLLENENKKTDAYFDQFKKQTDQMYQEMVSRINEDDQSYPYPLGDHLYYSKISKGDNYARYYRKNLDGSGETLLLDLNEIGKDKDFLSVGSISVSPSSKLLAYSLDFDGSEIYGIYIKDIQSGKIIESKIKDSTGSIEWSKDDGAIYYSKMDKTQRPFQVYFHEISQDPTKDEMIFENLDLSNYVGFDKSRSKRFVFIGASNKVTSEIHYIDLDYDPKKVHAFTERKDGVLLDVDHHEDTFVITTNEDAVDFKVLTTLLDQTDQKHWTEVFPHEQGRFIEAVSVFKDHWVLWERYQGSQSLRIYNPATKKIQNIPFTEKAYALSGENNLNYDAKEYRYGYSSFKSPHATLSYNVLSGKTQTLKVKNVPGPFNPDDYEVEKFFAPSRDGKTKIPMSVLKPKNFKQDGSGKVLLYGYGSYGHTIDPGFSVTPLSLVDRGFMYVIAHPRGSSTNGRSWYEDGKFLHKENTFHDFIDCAQYLIDQKYTQEKKIAIMGGSAGGLLMGAVTNKAPHLWGAVLALVPFVDVINTMLDESLPLTVTEYDEWGNPNEEKYFKYMYSYAPYENIKDEIFPPILATGGINDPRVGYWEPTKWALRLREHNQGNQPILIKMEMGAGHQGPSGRYNYYKERAEQFAFAMFELSK